MCENQNNNAASNGFTENRYNMIIKMLNTIAKREGIVNPKMEISKGSEKGDGYVGEKSRVLLQGDNKSMDLFIKGAPTDEKFKKAFDPRPMYLLEIAFYNDVFPTLNKFQTAKNIPKPLTSVIECIDTISEEGNEILILQNARSLGYELTDKMKQMNSEHVEFVYTEYGKYHGVSLALKDQQPIEYQALVDKIPINVFTFMAEKMYEFLYHIADKGKQVIDPIKEAEKYNTYSAYIDNLLDFYKNLVDYEDPYKVIVHGDCWSNNMMFKYTDKGNKKCPEKMCLIDFQLIGEGSPVLDLSYFLYASAPKEIYDNLDHYLHVYHDSLSKTIRDLGSDPEVLMPFDELKNQWKKFSTYGFSLASSVIKICTQEGDEIRELADIDEGKSVADMMAEFTKEGKNEALYRQRLKDLIDHVIDNEFI